MDIHDAVEFLDSRIDDTRSGLPEEIAHNPRVISAYLGSDEDEDDAADEAEGDAAADGNAADGKEEHDA